MKITKYKSSTVVLLLLLLSPVAMLADVPGVSYVVLRNISTGPLIWRISNSNGGQRFPY